MPTSNPTELIQTWIDKPYTRPKRIGLNICYSPDDGGWYGCLFDQTGANFAESDIVSSEQRVRSWAIKLLQPTGLIINKVTIF